MPIAAVGCPRGVSGHTNMATPCLGRLTVTASGVAPLPCSTALTPSAPAIGCVRSCDAAISAASWALDSVVGDPIACGEHEGLSGTTTMRMPPGGAAGTRVQPPGPPSILVSYLPRRHRVAVCCIDPCDAPSTRNDARHGHLHCPVAVRRMEWEQRLVVAQQELFTTHAAGQARPQHSLGATTRQKGSAPGDGSRFGWPRQTQWCSTARSAAPSLVSGPYPRSGGVGMLGTQAWGRPAQSTGRSRHGTVRFRT